MAQEPWTAVDDHFHSLFAPHDDVLAMVLQSGIEAGLPEIQVSPNLGKMLEVMVRSIGARTVLEIGTLAGYSSIWMARALPPDGRIVTLEADSKHAQVARANFTRAGVADKVDVIEGRGLDTLPRLAAEGRGPFDFVFIDADKPSYTDYLEWSLKLTRPGSMIVADNVVRDGEVINPNSSDVSVQGVRRFIAALAAEPRVTATAIQTVGAKGYDGFAVAVVM